MSPLENAGEAIRIFARPQIRRPGLEATPQPISGTVYAWRTPDWWSDTRFITSPSACLRNPVLYEQEEVRVELWNTTGTTLYDTEYTDSDGEYSLVPPSPGNYLVRATLGGQNWDVVYFDGQCGTTTPDPVDQELASVASGTTTADFYFGGTSSTYSSLAQPIADTNVHEAVRICMSYWRSVVPGNSPLNDEFMVWTDRANYANANYIPSSSTWSCIDTLGFGAGASPNFTVHYGSATIAAHEFGHMVGFRLGILLPDPIVGSTTPSFSEGFSDACVGVLLPDAAGSVRPTIIGPDTQGDDCGTHVRQPLVFDPHFPLCFSASPDVQASSYLNGMLLAAAWMDIRASIGFADTQELFGTWTLLATPPGLELVACQPCSYPGGPPCSSCVACIPDESAGANTFYEVLIADDDDDDLSNSTPNGEVICTVFGERRIPLEIDAPVCPEKAPTPHIPDCDRSGHVDVFDCLLYQSWHATGSSSADVNADGILDILDWMEFFRQYESVRK